MRLTGVMSRLTLRRCVNGSLFVVTASVIVACGGDDKGATPDTTAAAAPASGAAVGSTAGAVNFLTPDSPPDEAHSFEHGLTLLRELLPGTLQGNDPVPFRHVVFRIHLDEVTGRAAKSGTLPSDR